jgi:hypothetical protein
VTRSDLYFLQIWNIPVPVTFRTEKEFFKSHFFQHVAICFRFINVFPLIKTVTRCEFIERRQKGRAVNHGGHRGGSALSNPGTESYTVPVRSFF